MLKCRLCVGFQNKALAFTISLRIISKTEESAAERIECKDLGHNCFDFQGLLLCQFVGRCQKSSNVEEMIAYFWEHSWFLYHSNICMHTLLSIQKYLMINKPHWFHSHMAALSSLQQALSFSQKGC